MKMHCKWQVGMFIHRGTWGLVVEIASDRNIKIKESRRGNDLTTPNDVTASGFHWKSAFGRSGVDASSHRCFMKMGMLYLLFRELCHFFIDRAARTDGGYLYSFRRYSINDSEFANPEASITCQLPLKRFSFSRLHTNLFECIMDAFLQCGMQSPDVC